ncbi:MAG: DUF2207 domain-containing protein [Notoacmeibacter sp.]|nr:DUF2207 domain-containing protein [Notoacmeibacter sp.]MCC0032721.1 DUF2207 domain-containing protein [Brucellaceae bacterium]
MIARLGPILGRHALRFLLLLVLAAGMASAVQGRAGADERILSFDSDVTLSTEGVLTVVETIKVRAEHGQIKRGIFRDFPLRFQDDAGRLHKVSFDVQSVKRDGWPENWFIERSSKIARLYIGQKDKFVERGEHTYVITYTSDRQIRFFDTHDELFWNATGNAWTFPIDQATATLRLPEGGVVQDVVYFTGGQGSTAREARAQVAPGKNSASFSTTRPLGSFEGLTVGVKFAKGLVAQPTGEQEFSWLMRDNPGPVVLGGGALLLLVYYGFGWWLVGRDPPAGVIVPRWDAPEGISPSLANYIDQKGLAGQGWDAIAAGILSLAVRGHLRIDDVRGKVKLVLADGRPSEKLPTGEAAIIDALKRNGGKIELDKAHGSKVKTLNSRFVSAMEGEHRRKFYIANWPWVIGGVIISFLCVFAMAVTGGLAEEEIVSVLMVTVFAGFGLIVLLPVLRNLGSGLKGKFQSVFFGAVALFVVFNALTKFVGDLAEGGMGLAIAGLVGLTMINIVFYFLMGAPTPLGRRMMDGLEGLKTYIRLAESDRLNLQGAPAMSPQHYETILPYAVALKLEKPWTKAFQTWLLTAAAAGAAGAALHYGPRWYSGGDFSPDRLDRTMDSVTKGLESSMAAAMPVPKSSSSGFSGSGGFSGGGGGGGGGGGW